MKKQLILPLLFIVALSACDKVDDPFPEKKDISFSLDETTEYIVDADLNINDTTALKKLFTDHQWDTIAAPDNSTKRFIVVEEFTGHKCLNCPRGTWEIVRLDNIHQEQLIPVAIHAGTFAEPRPPKYSHDHRVGGDGGAGDTYLNTFGVTAYPSAMVSRTRQAELLSDAQWDQRINSIKNDIPKVKIDLKNYIVKDTNSSAANILRIQIDIEWLDNLTKEHQLQVFLTEDNIIDWQDSAGVDLEFYNHRHMLRKVVNGNFGLELEAAEIGKKASYQYITTVDNKWKAKDMESVVFIFEKSPSYEIIQGNAAHLR